MVTTADTKHRVAVTACLTDPMTTHAVVDGSNIATEGRSEPSLVQLREAVEAFRDEHDFDQITVIVDASFEHRVSTSERERPVPRSRRTSSSPHQPG